MTATWTIKGSTITINTATGTITGSTYNLKDFIKENFEGIRWDGSRKCWAMDGTEMEAIINKRSDYFTRAYAMKVIGAPVNTKNATINNGRCPRCGGYCYGDCTSN